MIKSMTAYAASEKNSGFSGVTVEIRSYNSRYLDLVLRIPGELALLEERIRQIVSQWIQRGRIEVKVQLKNETEQVSAFEIDIPRAAAYHDALVQLRESFGLKSGISLELMVEAGGMIKPADTQKDPEALWELMRPCLGTALENHDTMRKKEGDFILLDFEKRLRFITDGIKKVKENENGLCDHYRKRLEERIGVLTKGMVEIDPARIAQEAAFLADRSDISEELIRCDSHIEQFREIMNSDEPAGRKLNFLLQEINREFNTMGVKAQSADTSHVVVSIKAELEKIREQVQNIE